MTNITSLQRRSRSVCCDFHDEPEDIAAHLAKWEAIYAVGVVPPEGWKILPFLTVVEGRHREYTPSNGWLSPRHGCSTMTPIFARPSGQVTAFAVPN